MKVIWFQLGASITALDYTLKTLQVLTEKDCFLLRAEKFVNIDLNYGECGHGGALLQTGVGETGLCALVLGPRNSVTVLEAKEGQIVKTICLDEAMKTNHVQIPLINPATLVSEHCNGTYVTHMAVLSETEQTLVLWNHLVVHLVSLKESTVLASCYSFRSILDLSVTEKGEIFVLESGRSLVRLAKTEDVHRSGEDWRQGETASQAPDSQLAASLEGFGAGLARRFSSLSGLAESFPLQPFASGWLERAERSLANKISPVEEAAEAFGDMDKNTEDADHDYNFKLKMDRIGELAFGPLLLQPKKAQSQKSPKRSPRPKSREILEDLNEVDPLLLPEPDPIVTSGSLRLAIHSEDSATPHRNNVVGRLPDPANTLTALSQEMNLSDEEKEKTLLKMLDLDMELRVNDSEESIDKGKDKKSLIENCDFAPIASEGVYSRCTSIQYGPPSDCSAQRASADASFAKENPKPGADETNDVEEKPFEALLFPEIKQELQVSAEDLVEGKLILK